MLQGAERDSALRYSDVLVLPTHSENFGLVIAEALAYETPVITTHAAPWAIVQEKNCGWWIPDSIDALQNTLEDSLSRTTEELEAMGRSGRELVASEFTWADVAKRMGSFYRWCLDRTEVPEFVSID